MVTVSPGAYSPNYDSVKPVPTKQSFTRTEDKTQPNFEDVIVGPGTYDLNDDWEKTAPAYGFGTERRDKFYSINDNPGPGEYEQSGVFDRNAQNNKGPSLAGKNIIEPNEFDVTPAAGDYDPKVPRDKITGGDIGKNERSKENKEAEITPGPLQYTVNDALVKQKNAEYSFGTSKRENVKRDKGDNFTLYDTRRETGSNRGLSQKTCLLILWE